MHVVKVAISALRGEPLPVMTAFATLNVGRNGIAKSGLVRPILEECGTTFCALQELDII